MSESPKPLLTLIDEVSSAAEMLRLSRSREHLRQRVSNVDSEFSEVLGEFKAVKRFVAECEKSSVPVLDYKPASSLIARLLEYQALVNTDPAGITEADDLPKILSQLRATANQQKEQTRAAWRNFCETNVPTPQPHYLALLATSSSSRDDANSIANLDQQIEYIRAQDPIVVRGIPQKLVSLLRQRRQLWQQLDADDLPDAVMSFISSASQTGAPLASLTPVVKDWLSQHDLIDGYVIIPRAT